MRVTALGWAPTIGVILALLALDLLLATVRPHAISYREATAWSVSCIMVAGVSAWSSPPGRDGDTALSTSPATSWKRACPSTTSSSS